VTGTSGKTTTTYVLEAIWQAMDCSAGVIGTVNYRYQGREEPAPFTTPEAVELQSLLHTMVEADVTHAVMEVSSHALVQERVRGCQWDGAVFTNLGRDHLDFHTDLDDYFAAKARLFISELVESPKKDRFAVVNADDPWGEKLLTYQLPGRVLTYGLADRAGVSVRDIEQSFSGMRGTLCLEGKDIAFSSRLIGEPHVYNILAAAATAHALGIPAEIIVAGLAECTGVPGRLETIEMGQDFAVIVDYAHKPNALEKTLHSIRQLTQQRLITVFGCGGDRDTGKRLLMGEAAGRLSDVVIVTSDNPRTEDPQRILNDAEQGLMQTDLDRAEDSTQAATIAELQRGYLVVADRREAIHVALSGARVGDVVVIAGKGHEDYQIIGTTKHHFDDREEVRQYFRSQEVV
jgi:UDP-N-acetylmuramoyl-L-alanyl-D-glutamate--2,6-diaminopimelate ligase